jgi:hypothetical protein
MKPETNVRPHFFISLSTHVDLEEMRSDVTNCHPHPIGIEREQQRSPREAEVDLDQRP